MANQALVFTDTPMADYLKDMGDKADIKDPPPYSDHHSPNCTLVQHVKYSFASFIASATGRCMTAIDSITHPALSVAELKQFRDAFKYNIASSRLLDDPLSKSLSLHKDALNSSSPNRPISASKSQHPSFPFIPSACRRFVSHATIRSIISTAMLAVAVIVAYLQNQRNSEGYRHSYVVLTSLALSAYIYRATQRFALRRACAVSLDQLNLLIAATQSLDSRIGKGFHIITQAQCAAEGYRSNPTVPISRIERNSTIPLRFPRLRRLLLSSIDSTMTVHARGMLNLKSYVSRDLLALLCEMGNIDASFFDIRRRSLDEIAHRLSPVLSDFAPGTQDDRCRFSIAVLRQQFLQLHSQRRELFCALMALQGLDQSTSSVGAVKQRTYWQQVTNRLKSLTDETNLVLEKVHSAVDLEEKFDVVKDSQDIQGASLARLLALFRKLGAMRSEWESISGKLMVLQQDAMQVAKESRQPSGMKPLRQQYAELEEDFVFMTDAVNTGKQALMKLLDHIDEDSSASMNDGLTPPTPPDVSSFDLSLNVDRTPSPSRRIEDEDLELLNCDDSSFYGDWLDADEKVLEGIAGTQGGDLFRAGSMPGSSEDSAFRQEIAKGQKRLMNELFGVLNARMPLSRLSAEMTPTKAVENVDQDENAIPATPASRISSPSPGPSATIDIGSRSRMRPTPTRLRHEKSFSMSHTQGTRRGGLRPLSLVELNLPPMIAKEDGMIGGSSGEED